MKKLLLLSMLLFASQCGCQPSPESLARATVIAAQPGQTAMAAAPGIQATATAVAVEGYIATETQDDWVAFKENVIWWGSICACGLLVVASLVVGKFAYRAGQAAEKATAKKADLAASVIRIDRKTKTWPILVDWQQGRVLNLETGAQIDIQAIMPHDARLIATSHRVREAGVLADAAVNIAKSTKDAQPADMLPGMAASVPLLKSEDE